MLTKDDTTIVDVEGKKEKIIDNLRGFAGALVDCIANASFDMPLEDEAINSNQSLEQEKVATTEDEEPKKDNITQEQASETLDNKEDSSESHSFWYWLSSLVGYGSPTPPGSPDKSPARSSVSPNKSESAKELGKDSRSLIGVFERASKHYLDKDSYWSLISGFFRQRSFEQTINDLKSFSDPILRLQAFYLFTSAKGATWHSGSANVAVYTSAIRVIPGYENDEQSVSDEFIHRVIIPNLRPLVDLEIIARIEGRAEFLDQKEVERRKVEAECQVYLNQAASIELFNDAELARKTAVDNPEKQVFHLSARKLSAKELELKQKRTKSKIDENELVWQFTWYDSTGNPNLLEMTSGLESLLTSFHLIDTQKESVDSEIKLKLAEFSRLEKEYEERTNVVLEPSAEELEDLKSSYVITKKDKQYQLTWYDNQGNKVPLVLSHHYLLATWLATKENLTKEDLPVLRIYLQPQFANPELSLKICCRQLAEEHLARTKVLINPSSKELQNLSLTYVIAGQDKEYELTWYDSFGKTHSVNLEGYDSFSKWLKDKEALSHEELPRLRTYLQQVKMRNEVNQTAKKSLGREILEKKGVTLICTDDLQRIPPYKLSVGIYILTRSPDPKTGEWILYQRQKGGVNIPVNVKDEGSNDWDDFHRFLAEKQSPFSAVQLTSNDQAKLKKKIMAAMPVPKEKNLCRAVEAFQVKHAREFPACTFVVTKKDSEWQLFYIDTLQHAVAVSVSSDKLPKVHELFSQWKEEEAQSLVDEQLKELSSHLIDYKPANQIKMSEFSLIAKCIAGQLSKQKELEETTKSHESLAEDSSTQSSDQVSEESTFPYTRISMPEPGRLNLSDYTKVSEWWGKRTVLKNGESASPCPRTSMPEPGRLNLSDYTKVTAWWGERPVLKPEEQTPPKQTSEDSSVSQSVYNP
ncbi:hypothetical protein [Legionella nautarum]|nr:hypothetical protein [Legionella nautarum]